MYIDCFSFIELSAINTPTFRVEHVITRNVDTSIANGGNIKGNKKPSENAGLECEIDTII